MFSTINNNNIMVSLEILEATPPPAASAAAAAITSSSCPRISFSADFLNDCNFITINPSERSIRNPDHFEFLSGDLTMISTADELFFEGKLLPFWHNNNRETHDEKQSKIIGVEEKDGNIVAEINKEEDVKKNVEEGRMNWFVDDDPSPRPPKCTVLWKELLRLKKQRAPPYHLSPSSSSSSSSSGSLGGNGGGELGEKEKEKEKEKRKKGLERSRSGTLLRIRPMVNVPICNNIHGKSINTLPPLFPHKKPHGLAAVRRHK